MFVYLVYINIYKQFDHEQTTYKAMFIHLYTVYVSKDKVFTIVFWINLQHVCSAIHCKDKLGDPVLCFFLNFLTIYLHFLDE